MGLGLDKGLAVSVFTIRSGAHIALGALRNNEFWPRYH